MFVPRALRLKGIKEPQRQKTVKSPTAEAATTNEDDALVDAMQGITTSSLEAQHDNGGEKVSERGPRFTVKPVTSEYIAQLAAGIELIFSDYAHQEPERAEWLQKRYRVIDDGDKFLHLTAILEHPNISTLKPEASQTLLRQALQDLPSNGLELSHNAYHVRRKPSSYPPFFVPLNSFEVVDDDGLNFWDQRTIYVEPHLRNMCQTPAKVAHWLKEHGELRSKWLPIQAVHMLWNSCAFVVLSGSVVHQGIWDKWRANAKPVGWKIMTKVEHTKRTAEYVELLKKENLRGMRRRMEDINSLPAIAKPASLAMDVDRAADYAEPVGKTKSKRKRTRAKANKSDMEIDDAEGGQESIAAEAQAGEPATKRQS